MAPLPIDSTPRFWLDYTDGIFDHTMMFRYSASTTLSDVMGGVDNFLNQLSPDLYEITILGARAAASGSNVSLPVTWEGAGTYGSGGALAVTAPRELTFLARASDGRRSRVSVYGLKLSTPDTYRFNPDDDSAIDSAVAALALMASSSQWISISVHALTVYTYVDVNFNSYWERKSRG